MNNEYEKLKIRELHELAKSRGIKSIKKYKKEELIRLIGEADAKGAERTERKAAAQLPEQRKARRHDRQKQDQTAEGTADKSVFAAQARRYKTAHGRTGDSCRHRKRRHCRLGYIPCRQDRRHKQQ